MRSHAALGTTRAVKYGVPALIRPLPRHLKHRAGVSFPSESPNSIATWAPSDARSALSSGGELLLDPAVSLLIPRPDPMRVLGCRGSGDGRVVQEGIQGRGHVLSRKKRHMVMAKPLQFTTAAPPLSRGACVTVCYWNADRG